MDYYFSDDLKAIREILGITQTELAKRIGVQQVTLSRNELGKTGASQKLLEQEVYKIVKPKELRGLFLPYHTMDAAQAIDRILEAKGFANDNIDEEKRQFEIFKRIRNIK